MGNTCCCCSCSAPDQVNYQDIFDKVIQVEDMSHIDELISYIEQLLTAIDQGNLQSIAHLAKTNRVTASLNSSDGLLEKILKRSKHVCKRDIVPNLNRESRKLVIDVTNQGAQIKWVGVVLSVVGFVLERIEQVSSNREECLVLLKYMFNLARYIKQLEDHLGNQEKLNRVLQFIVEGSLLCISQMQSHPLSKFFGAPVTADDLQKLRRGLGQEYSELTMESIIVVLDRIPVVLPQSQGRTPQAVGIEEATNSVIELLDMKVQSVKAVVICGHGGIGKTTLAETVFSKLDLQNYKYCKVYLEQDCSEADLKFAQQQISRDLYGPNINFRSLNEGRDELSKYFKEQSSKPVFIFVDNALKQSDLEKLLPVPISDLASLPPQSRILLTTRNLSETRSLSQPGVERCHYQVPCLRQDKAREILCELALDSAHASFDPTIDINGLLEICQGIPLVLKMAGPRLREHAQNAASCRETVEYLKSSLLKGGEGDLSESMVDFVYSRLDDSCKEAFLDIVFFYCNWKRQRVVSSVGSTEFNELQSAALVNVTSKGRVNVHDIVKARGRMLSGDGKRITDLQSLTDALQDAESIKKIKGIALNESFELEAHHLNMMKRSLRVLSLTGNTRIINGECRGAFENLRLLSIENHKNYSWMDVSKHPNLLAIILRNAEVPNVPDIGSEDSNVPEFAATIPSSLRYAYIERVRLTHLITTLHQVQFLNCLTLRHCSGFNSLPESISNLFTLEGLNLRSCSSLGSLPYSFGSLSHLQHLDLGSCSSLGSLPDSFGSLSSLQHLDLGSCSILGSLPDSFGSLSCLKYLDLGSCSSLGSLSDSFGSLSSLQHLDLKLCSSLGSLPDSFGSLSCLKHLDLGSCSSLGSLPDSFGSLSRLQHLDLRSCSSLGSLPDSFGSLSCLQHLDLKHCSSLGSLPDSFGSLSHLQHLDLQSCDNLGSLPDSFGSLSHLQHLDLWYCSSLGSLPDSFGSLSHLQHLDLWFCSSLGSLSDNFGSLSCLQHLYLGCCSSLGSLPDSFGSLFRLQHLNLRFCDSLGSLPDSFGSLSSLQHLDLGFCSILGSLPDSFGSLSCLKHLDLWSCSSLGSLPDSFGSLSCLQHLDLSSCSSLRSLPNSFGSLYKLLELHLVECTQLSLLPESFGNLASLKSLRLQDCEKLMNLPQNFDQLKYLEHVSMHGCSALHSLSGDFECLSSLTGVKASECSQLEENTIDTLAKMKGLMVVDIDKSPKLKERWEQVKEHYSFAVVECGRQVICLRGYAHHVLNLNVLLTLQKLSDEIYPDADVMRRAFFHSESKFVHVDENGQLREWPSPAVGVKLWVLLKERDVTSSASSNRRCWEALKKKWMDVVASEGGQMIFVDVGGSWEERERRFEEALPHLPSGTVAWMPPDNRARLLFTYSVQRCYKRHIVEKKDNLGVGNCIVSTSLWVDEEGRRRIDLDHLQFILPDFGTLPLAESENENISEQLLSPIRDALEFLQT